MTERQRILQERQARVELILDSAEKAFVEKGYSDTSVNEIAEMADFSRTSIYQYFNSKEEMYFALLDRYADVLIERLTEATGRPNRTVDKIRAFLEEIRQVMKLKPNLFSLYFVQRHQVEPRLSPGLKAQLRMKRRRLENIFRDLYREGIEKGEVRDIRVKDASNLFFAQMTGMMLLHEYYGDEFDVTLDEHLHQSLQLYLEFIEKKD